MLNRKETSVAIASFLMSLTVSGCLADPLVVDDTGMLRSNVTTQEIEDAGVINCSELDVELSVMREIAIVDSRNQSLYIENSVAICLGEAGLGEESVGSVHCNPTPEPSVPDRRLYFGPTAPSDQGPTPEPSHTGPTPEPSLDQLETPEPSSDQGPTPEPSHTVPTQETSNQNSVTDPTHTGPTPEPSHTGSTSKTSNHGSLSDPFDSGPSPTPTNPPQTSGPSFVTGKVNFSLFSSAVVH